MTLCPVISGTRLSEDEVVGTEELTEWTSTDGVHGSWLEVDEDGTGNVFVAGSLIYGKRHLVIWRDFSYYLIEVDVHTLQLEVGRPVVPGKCQCERKHGVYYHCLHASAIESMLA